MSQIVNNGKANSNFDLMRLESMLGTSVSRNAGLQVCVDNNLPIKFPQNSVHYELYKNHVELHIESSVYGALCSFLVRHLPNNETAQTEARGFCKFAYVLNRRVEGWCNIEELGHAIIELRNIVEPVLMLYCDQMAENAELATVLGKYYEEQKEALPYHINVIDELHANENAHTRILLQLLKYKELGKRVILSSFLEQLPMFNTSLDLEKAHVFFNIDFIDGLIEREREYAIIIENKIHWATDQDKQIERYVDTEIGKGIPADKIWVIYLTRDGRKKVEDYSLTKKTQDILGERFVELDYYHHILPWLKDTILPNCRLKEEWLVSAIKQYVDHLEGLFDIRDSKKVFLKNVQSKIESTIGITKDMSRKEVYTRLNAYLQTLGELQNVVSNSLESMISFQIERFKKTTFEVLADLCPEEQVETYNGINDSYFQVLFKKWDDHVHFEWIPFSEERLFSATDYTLVLHVERADLQDRLDGVMRDESLMNKVSSLGLKRESAQKPVYYRKKIRVQRPISDMTNEELTDFLQEAYKDVNDIQIFISETVFCRKLGIV